MFGASFVAGAKKRPAAPSLPSDASIDVTGHAVAATTADEFTGFTNPVGSVYQSSTATSPSTNIKYIKGTDYLYLVARTTGEARDVEVTTWAHVGEVWLRLKNGTGIVFFHHLFSGSGRLRVRLVAGFEEGHDLVYDGTTSVDLYDTSDLAGEVSGYSTTATAGNTLTFGASGWEVYAKFNGVEFWRSAPDIRLPMHRGVVAFQAGSTYGFRDITVDWKPEAAIYSNPATGYIDMRDFGFRSVSDTGSINAGTNAYELTVANPSRWAVGDKIIVAVGGESGAGARNTVGVGGTWPALHYADDATMEADTGQASGVYAYADDTGKVRRSNGGGVWAAWDANLYYLNYKVPRALVATVTGKSGSVLTLDTAASVSTTTANVYLDNTDLFAPLFADGKGNSALAPRGRCVFPANLAVRGEIVFYLRDGTSRANGCKVIGNGRDVVTFFSPDGTNSIGLTFGADYASIIGVYAKGNIGLNGFGLNFSTNGISAQSGSTYPVGLRATLATSLQMLDCRGEDGFYATALSFCTSGALYRCKATVTQPQAYYVAWQIQDADGSYAEIVDCEVDSEYIIAGFEFFRSDYARLIRPVSRNGLISSNSSGGWVISYPVVTIEASSQYSEESSSVNQPVININSNIGNQSGNPASTMNLGGTITEPNIVHEGYIDGTDNVMSAIVVNEYNPAITINGGYIEYPTASWGSALGVNSTGLTTIVDGLDVNGVNSNTSWGEINLSGTGSIARNCRADTIIAPTEENNTSYP